MGVPKFFRYISERYPCISEPIRKDSFVCEFDNLYLDMNGIIHMCSHPDDKNLHFRIDEEKMYNDIFHYISYLFQLIGPRKVFYMAIDGVAPRAKMNQQRSRRFQTAREAREALQEALDKGEVLPTGKRFDSNCITPGTVFMVRLQEQLRHFVKHKVSTDRAWSKCKIILSGHETPGEGEHKIMDYIRKIRSQPNHDPNTRHCLYGLDADLIMLGFCTHEPNFSILREEVQFKKNFPRPSTPDENNFYLLHLSLLKDYIEQEFFSVKNLLPFGFDIDKIIDDWILMGFLVGNDFIPNLPNMVINRDALPQLYDIYKSVLPELGGYINENGKLNLKRFQTYMNNLAELDRKIFEDNQTDLKCFEGKSQNKSDKNKKNELDAVPKSTNKFEDALQKLIQATSNFAMDSNEEDLISFDNDENNGIGSEEDMLATEFTLHKRDYYMTKLKFEDVTKEVLQSQAECYVRGIQWILNYYYQGCSSWSWYYPHHYTPYLSDITNFSDMELVFDYGKPFKPFEQLLGVLPIDSKELLPEAFHHLMTSEESPIHHYYPIDFETDLNGKLQQWEAVVLIPFINENDLLSAMEPCYPNLTEDEKARNTTSPLIIYEYTSENLGVVHAPAYFPLIKACHALETFVWVEDSIISPDKVLRGRLNNPYRNDFFPGVPTLNHISFNCEFTKARVKVFDFPSRNTNAILHINYDYKMESSLDTLAKKYLGKVVWVGWPYITEAKVISISNDETRFEYVADDNKKSHLLESDVVVDIKKIKLEGFLSNKRNIQKKTVIDHYASRLGIDVGEVKTVIHAVSVDGYKYVSGPEGKLVYGVEWSENPVLYPLQTVIENIKVAPVTSEKLYKTVEEAYPVGDSAFIIMSLNYGCFTEIIDASEVAKSGRIKVQMTMKPEPILRIPEALAVSYYQYSRVAGAKCGISARLFGRITGNIFVTPKEKEKENKSGGGQRRNDRWIDIGLNMKSVKTNEKLVGFTHNDFKTWLYSVRCIDIVSDYISKFQSVFRRLEMHENFPISEAELLGDDDYTLSEIVEWIEAQPHKKYPWRSCTAVGLDPEEMQAINEDIQEQIEEINNQETKLGLKVKPHVLFKSDLRKGNVPPDPAITSFELYDRVVNISPNSSVPYGAKGTIVSIGNKKYNNSVKVSEDVTTSAFYQVQFDESFHSGMKVEGVEGARFYMVHGFNLLNITLGRSIHSKTNNKVQINNSSSQNQIKNVNNLRKNDGHNSAFASYTSVSPANPEKSPITLKPSAPKKISAPERIIVNNNQEKPKFQCGDVPFMANSNISLPSPQFLPSFPPAFQKNMYSPDNRIPQPVTMQTNASSNGTDILKSLLKIDNSIGSPIQTRNSNVNINTENIRDTIFPPNNPSMKQGSVENQQFYKSPPNKAQLPFPVKLILNNTPPQPQNVQQTSDRTSANFMPFVPMQVTKKINESNAVKPLETQNQQNSNSGPIITKKKKKSRIAANFKNVP